MENKNNIWIEKHRPETFEEIVGQDDIITTIESKIGNLPHMIFEGKSGTGKTTTAKIIATTINADFLELNSSEERGIEIVRGKIMSFCKHLSFNVEAPYKILFLDEMDSMTSEAQMALRPMMEKYAGNTRFIIGCNYLDKVIQPIKSRCKIYRFRPVDTESIIKRLQIIAEKEGIHVSIHENDYKEIAERARGDLRNAINNLQMGDYGNGEVAQIFDF